jgi:hypothetical protein
VYCTHATEFYLSAQSLPGPIPAGLMTIFYCLRFETPLTWRSTSPYLYPPGTGWPSYTLRHWIHFLVSYDSQGCTGYIRTVTTRTHSLTDCGLSSPVNCCGPSPTQSFLVSAPIRTHDYIFVLSRLWTGELAILAKDFPDFLQFLRINSSIIPQLSKERPPPKCFLIQPITRCCIV